MASTSTGTYTFMDYVIRLLPNHHHHIDLSKKVATDSLRKNIIHIWVFLGYITFIISDL